MTSVEHGALWANDLRRLRRPEMRCDGYVPVEIKAGWLIDELAKSSGVGEAEVRQHLALGGRAFGLWAFQADELAAWMWVTTANAWAPPLRRTLSFQPDEVHGYSVGTLQAHRGQGLSADLLACVGWRMAEEGYRMMWNGILDANLASQRAHVAANFRPVLQVMAMHDPEPSRLLHWPVTYADPRLVERARLIVA